jgi:hypothetical protein
MLAVSFLQRQFQATRTTKNANVLASATQSSLPLTCEARSTTHASDRTQDTSSCSTRSQLFRRMISLRRLSSNRSYYTSTSTARNCEQYSCIVHFLDDTERLFHIHVSRRDEINYTHARALINNSD